MISFTVIAFFWVGHHAIFRYFVALDRTLIALNLLFLGTIAFLPYPTDLLSQSNADTAAVIFYAICGAAAGLAEAGDLALRHLARNADLASDSAQPIRLFVLLRTLRIPAVFVLSIPVAVFNRPGRDVRLVPDLDFRGDDQPVRAAINGRGGSRRTGAN